MEVFEAVRTVLAVREFQDKPVPPDAARRIVEAAWLTGNAANRQPWHFIAVNDRGHAALARRYWLLLLQRRHHRWDRLQLLLAAEEEVVGVVLLVDVVDVVSVELFVELAGAEVEVELVISTAIDEAVAELAEVAAVGLDHVDGVVGEEFGPDFGEELAGAEVEG